MDSPENQQSSTANQLPVLASKANTDLNPWLQLSVEAIGTFPVNPQQQHHSRLINTFLPRQILPSKVPLGKQ